MAEITAAAVKTLREKTGLPMMDCKRALQETAGDEQKAITLLREAGAKTMEKRAGRKTSSGRVAVYTNGSVGAIVELQCEGAPVAGNEEFVQLANDLAQQLATGPGAASPEQLLGQPSPGKPGQTLKQQLDDLTNRIREVFRLERIERIDGTCGGYAHHNGATAVLLQIEGDDVALARDICMHVAALQPTAIGTAEIDPAEIDNERQILAAAARKEGKPEKIIDKMVEGRLKNFFAERCLAEQPFVKAEDGKKTVGKVAQEAGIKLVRFVHWELAKE